MAALHVQVFAHGEELGCAQPVSAQLVVEGSEVRLHITLHDPSMGPRMDSMAAGLARPGIVDVRQRPATLPQPFSDSDMSSDSDEEVPEVDALADIRARLSEAVDEDEERAAAVVSSVQVGALLELSRPQHPRPYSCHCAVPDVMRADICQKSVDAG